MQKSVRHKLAITFLTGSGLDVSPLDGRKDRLNRDFRATLGHAVYSLQKVNSKLGGCVPSTARITSSLVSYLRLGLPIDPLPLILVTDILNTFLIPSMFAT